MSAYQVQGPPTRYRVRHRAVQSTVTPPPFCKVQRPGHQRHIQLSRVPRQERAGKSEKKVVIGKLLNGSDPLVNIVQELAGQLPPGPNPVLEDEYSEVAPSPSTLGLYSMVVSSPKEECSRVVSIPSQEEYSRVVSTTSQEVYSELGTDSSGVSSGSGSPCPASRRLHPAWENLAGAPWYQAGMPRYSTGNLARWYQARMPRFSTGNKHMIPDWNAKV